MQAFLRLGDTDAAEESVGMCQTTAGLKPTLMLCTLTRP